MVYATLETLHGELVLHRRVRTLIAALGRHVQPGDHILDVGTGDGIIALGIAAAAAGVQVEGIDVRRR